MSRPKKAKKSKRGQPRPRVAPFWRSRKLQGVLLVVLVGLVVGGGWRLHQSSWITKTMERAKWELIAASARIGFKVDEILVVGRDQTEQKNLLAAVQLVRGAPILAFDLKAARERVESLPWIKTAIVERMLPDTVLLSIRERKPMALWQHKGVFALIDFDGEVILRRGLERFSDLILVVGADAPDHTAALLKTLATEPQLMGMVKAAVRVGGRRWNLRLEGDIDVRLPELDTAAAWARLAEYEKTHRVLERDVQVLDLRQPDRLIVRKNRNRPKAVLGKRQQT